VALAAQSFSFSVRLRVQIVELTTLALNVVAVRAYHLAPLALGKLAHVDPNLFFLPATEVTIVHVGLIISNRCLCSLCLCADSELSSETLIAPGDVRVSHHSTLDKLKARGALIRG